MERSFLIAVKLFILTSVIFINLGEAKLKLFFVK